MSWAKGATHDYGGHKRPITVEERDAIIAALRSGEAEEAVAEKFARGVSTVRRLGSIGGVRSE